MGAPIVTGHVVAGRYRLISALGNGGMGTVWLAHDGILSRQVAVKEVSPPADMTEHERAMLRERTLREAQTAARLSHPNVVTIYDVVEDDGRPWIVMELVRSRSLREVVEADGPLTAQQAASVGLQVLAALSAAHALGIMHRDVKPGNVLIDPDGRAILADFGIARTQDSPALTTSGVLVGSPSYIAPERARGEPGGPESDLWSLGATLYALVEGRPAYDRAGALATLMAVVNEDPDPPSRAGALWPVIRGLLDHVPSRRLGPAEAGRMLRQVAESGDGSRTAPLPAAAPGAARDESVTQTRTGSSLESAEHTRTLRPWDAVAPAEPDPGPLLPEPEELRGEPAPDPLAGEPSPLPAGPESAALPQEPAPDALPEEPGPGALPQEPDPDALPEEPGPGALPHEPDLDALHQEPGPHVRPDEPGPAAMPDEPESGASPDQADPGVLPDNSGSHDLPDKPESVILREPGAGSPATQEPEPEPAVVPEAHEVMAPVSITAEERAPRPEPEPEPGTADSGLIPGLPGRPRSAAKTQEIGVRPRRKQFAWMAAAAALVVAAGVAAAIILTSHHTPRNSANPPQPTGRPAYAHSATPTSAGTASAQPASPTPTSGSGPLGPATIPAGYHEFRNVTGFSIAVPNGWRVSHQGHYVYLLPPSGAEFLLIDQSDHPKPNPLRDWQQQEANRESTYPGYHRIRLEAVRYPQAEKAADWEFTYYHQGVLTHVLNRNILANSHHAYALYWSTPESEWSQLWHIFKVLAQTFRPASP